MTAPTELFLEFNDIDGRWKVLDIAGFVFGDGATEKDAVQSARTVTKAPIRIGHCKWVCDSDYTTEEIIEELAELAGMKVIECYDKELNHKGYMMELRE